MHRLQDRVAVITGAGSGIGLASARRFASEGARVVRVDIDASAGEKAAREVDGLFVRADVTVEAEVAGMFETAHTTFGSVDIAFDNAGISPPDDDSTASQFLVDGGISGAYVTPLGA
ncbi:short chain dehydrogenase [Sinosporangium album]|uniref:Short chain dehydrogenase n=1 Tax=Sinosporangium album TaxID=504805 RepID=A0A1G7V894_9ACTN|nr:SDR family NAD(P)-dependent oxidoreductase [Sinosporangium album]SDG56006.1 short chain dehydrogenase [Sinosporangium album]